MNTISILALSVAFLSPAADAIPREEFCQTGLADLESYLSEEWMETYNDTSLDSQCTCSEVDNLTKSFVVDCITNGTEGSDVFEESERIVFELNQGEYAASKVYNEAPALTDEELYIPEEVVYLEDGVVTSCKVNACSSCTVCNDTESIAYDCSNRLYEDYITECNEGYQAPFASMYDFGVITGEDEETTQNLTTDEPVDQEEFCRRLASLELHMDKSFENREDTLFTTSHICDCSEVDIQDKSFAVYCTMEGIDEDDVFFEYSEEVVFELNEESQYKLYETSWSYLWDFNGTYASLDYQEVLNFDVGVLTSCEVNNCTSCSVCEDKKTIAVNCSTNEYPYTLECGANYTGTFAHLFHFGLINETNYNETN